MEGRPRFVARPPSLLWELRPSLIDPAPPRLRRTLLRPAFAEAKLRLRAGRLSAFARQATRVACHPKPKAKGGAACRTRTYDPRITNAMLYQLS